jgi:hypothetical protein
MKLTYKICLSLAFAFLAANASADGPSVKEWAHKRVDNGLIKPLKEKEAERSSFSRVMQAPKERRLRILQAAVSKDKQGRAFVSYAVDVRYGDEWHDDITGCVYRGSGQIFVQRGDEYRPAEFLLGKNVKAVSGVCEAAPARDRA